MYSNAEGKACCSNQAIDPVTTSCRLQGGQEYGYSLEHTNSSSCQEGTFDNTQDTCCDGVLHVGIINERCCGAEIVRDPEKEVCCGGKLRQLLYPNAICCDGKLFDGNRYTCCGNKPLLEGKLGQKCCNGKIVSTYDRKTECGQSSLSSDSATNSTSRREAHFQASPTSLLNATGVESPFPSVQDKQPFSTADTTQPLPTSTPDNTISHEPPQQNSTTQDLPCGDVMYNNRTSECCAQQVLDHRDNKRCCNNIIYNRRKQTCINGTLQDNTICGKYILEFL